ncbi:MAG: hypothetical protein ACLUFN_10465 [Eubacterium sp.]
MSKEKKLAKKEQKAAKKAAKLEKKQAADYAKLVKGIDKKNAKLEKKANKKGKPFVPIAVPSQEEAFAAATGSKPKKIILTVILVLLIWLLVYFLVMWFSYVAPIKGADEDAPSSTPATYERYSNPHEITTTPDYSVSEAQALLKQVLHDNWKVLGYGSDPSSGSINYTSNIVNVNNQDCYVFTAGSKTYAVSVKLSAVYLSQNGTYTPITFEDIDILFN